MRSDFIRPQHFLSRMQPILPCFLFMIINTPLSAQDGMEGPPPSPVYAEQVRIENVTEYRKVTGNIKAVVRSSIATIEAGLVMTLPVMEGDTVQQGDTLAHLDDRRLVLQLKQLDAQRTSIEATIAERTAQLHQAQRDLRLLQELAQRKAGNPKELGDAESEVEINAARLLQSQRELEVLQAQYELLETRLSDMTITAPFTGMVIQKNTEVGQWVGVGDSLLELVSVDSYEAWLDVPQKYAQATMQPGAGVLLGIESAGIRTESTDYRVVREVDPKARTFSVIVPLDDPDQKLAAGMSMSGWIPSGQRGSYITVPRDAIMLNQTGFYVYVAAEMGPDGMRMAEFVPIEITFELKDTVAIVPGALQDGDFVITEGNERLFPSMPVMLMSDNNESAANPAEILEVESHGASGSHDLTEG